MKITILHGVTQAKSALGLAVIIDVFRVSFREGGILKLKKLRCMYIEDNIWH